MIKANVKDRKYRHGNCVPFIITNVKTGTITYKGSLKEVAHKLKITTANASDIHRRDRKVSKGKSIYTITRLGFDTMVNFN